MNATSLTSNNEATILRRTIDADNGNWSVEVARGMLSLALSPADGSRINELAAKARDGVLTSGICIWPGMDRSSLVSAIGRVTIHVLWMNHPLRVETRRWLIAAGTL